MSGSSTVPPEASSSTGELTQALAAALVAYGLDARVVRGTWVRAANPAADAATDDPRGKALNPGLMQTVACGPYSDGRLFWFWQWSAATREAPSEYEPLCPAEDIDRAAEKIARVLRLDGIDSPS